MVDFEMLFSSMIFCSIVNKGTKQMEDDPFSNFCSHIGTNPLHEFILWSHFHGLLSQ